MPGTGRGAAPGRVPGWLSRLVGKRRDPAAPARSPGVMRTPRAGKGGAGCPAADVAACRAILAEHLTGGAAQADAVPTAAQMPDVLRCAQRHGGRPATRDLRAAPVLSPPATP